MQIDTKQEFTMTARVIRADGRQENLGVIVGGSPLQHLLSYLRIKLANLKQKVAKSTQPN